MNKLGRWASKSALVLVLLAGTALPVLGSTGRSVHLPAVYGPPYHTPTWMPPDCPLPDPSVIAWVCRDGQPVALITATPGEEQP